MAVHIYIMHTRIYCTYYYAYSYILYLLLPTGYGYGYGLDRTGSIFLRYCERNFVQLCKKVKLDR